MRYFVTVIRWVEISLFALPTQMKCCLYLYLPFKKLETLEKRIKEVYEVNNVYTRQSLTMRTENYHLYSCKRNKIHHILRGWDDNFALNIHTTLCVCVSLSVCALYRENAWNIHFVFILIIIDYEYTFYYYTSGYLTIFAAHINRNNSKIVQVM